jgi:hypothetical protein
MCSPDKVPVFVAENPDFAAHVERASADELRFRFTGVDEMEGFAGLELIPFFRLHRSRYMLYWPFSTPAGLELRNEHVATIEAERLALDARTIDKVAPGEQQPEVEHNFVGENTEAGTNFGRHWRHAAGWFGYTLSDPAREARFLRIDYWGADQGRTFRIEMNGKLIAEVTSTGEHGPEFVSIDYALDEAVLAGADDGQHELRFVAADGSIAGGIYGVRLLREVSDD